MAVLEPPDSHFLNAATGWLELGNPREAGLELDRITPDNQSHPAVLESRWRSLADQKQWESALAVACLRARTAPNEPDGWIEQSYALHEMRRTREAVAVLLPLIKRFPAVSTIPYNLACYACQLGDQPLANKWLEKAVKIRGREEIKALALKDQDLKPLWPEIGRW